MKKVTVKELTNDNFKVYGSFSNMINPKTPKLGQEPVEFYRDMATLKLGQTGVAAFSVTRVVKRPNIIDAIEYHNYTGEAMLPLDGDVLIHLAPATPVHAGLPLDQIEVFRVPKGTLVVVNPGVWHCGPFTDGSDCVNVLVVLPERTYANDCIFKVLDEKDRIEIVT